MFLLCLLGYLVLYLYINFFSVQIIGRFLSLDWPLTSKWHLWILFIYVLVLQEQLRGPASWREEALRLSLKSIWSLRKAHQDLVNLPVQIREVEKRLYMLLTLITSHHFPATRSTINEKTLKNNQDVFRKLLFEPRLEHLIFIWVHFIISYSLFSEWSEVAKSCPTLCDPMDCSPPGSSIHEILQARVLTGVGCHLFKMDLDWVGCL